MLRLMSWIAVLAVTASVFLFSSTAGATSNWDSMTIGSPSIYNSAVSSSSLNVSDYETLITTIAPTGTNCANAGTMRTAWYAGSKNARVVLQVQDGTTTASERFVYVLYSTRNYTEITPSFLGSGTGISVSTGISNTTSGYGYRLYLDATSSRPDKLSITCINGAPAVSSGQLFVGTGFSYRVWPINHTGTITYPSGYVGAYIPNAGNPDTPVTTPPTGGSTDVSNLVSKDDIRPIFKVLGGTAAITIVGGACWLVLSPFLHKRRFQ